MENSKKENFLSAETIAIHTGYSSESSQNAVMPPIVLSSTFEQKEPGKPSGFEYSRTNNPNRKQLEQCIAALENAQEAIAFSSGCAAIAALMLTLEPGEQIISSLDIYGGTYRLLTQVFEKYGIKTQWINLQNPEELAQSLTQNTGMVWLETPSNPTLQITDIEAIAKITKSRGINFIVDNTFATPILQNPIQSGATASVHSTTKYINGHSDVIGGIVATNNQHLIEKLRFTQTAFGAVPSPFDCFLTSRGLKTLPLRMEKHCKNASTLALWLKSQLWVKKVFYPGLPSHPNFFVAKKQMKNFGGIVSFELRGNKDLASQFVKRTQLFKLAESLGGVESLIELPGLMTHAFMPHHIRQKAQISDTLVRLSVGIENIKDLIHDLDRAAKLTFN